VVEGIAGDRERVTIVDNPGEIAPTGLNLAYAQAQGEILIRVDGHCEIAPDYISNCVRHLLEDGVDGVGGSCLTVGETAAARSIALASASRFGVGGSSFRTVSGRDMMVDTIPFPAYPRMTMEKAGAYDEEMVRDQDDEYNFRIRDQGGRLLLAADVNSIYYSRSSLRGLAKQYYQYGFWKVRVAQKHPGRMRLRHFVPSLLVLGLAGSAVASLWWRIARVSLVFLLVAYSTANVSASLWLAVRHGLEHLRTLPLAFAAMHFGYGSGFLVGVIRFVRRWGPSSAEVRYSARV
ncbi:MAG TPA: glycosyltransferase family 2 protein, partial [Thermoleophilia bacterium]|nr:glycosyltransferase family 2 protein [Thermoleophilia bacterium]